MMEGLGRERWLPRIHYKSGYFEAHITDDYLLATAMWWEYSCSKVHIAISYYDYKMCSVPHFKLQVGNDGIFEFLTTKC